MDVLFMFLRQFLHTYNAIKPMNYCLQKYLSLAACPTSQMRIAR